MSGLCRLVLVCLTLVLSANSAVAQEHPAMPASAAASYLPGIDRFGDGWSMTRTAGLEVNPDVFREGAVVVFVGPNGARVVAAVMLVTQERIAIRRSWEVAMTLYDNYSGELEYLNGREKELDSVPAPEGCDEAKRNDGTARQLRIDTGIPMGVTLCAAEPDLIAVAVVSGSVFGLVGFEASDRIASMIVSPESDAPAIS